LAIPPYSVQNSLIISDHTILIFLTFLHLALSLSQQMNTRRLFTTAFKTLNVSLTKSHSLLPIIRPLLTHRTMASAAAKRLTGKTILVTGASSGIGRSTALEFARTAPKNDLRLILTARRVDTLKELAEQIKSEVGDGVQVLPFKLDVSNSAEVKSIVNNLPKEWRNIDVLVNNA
jgi:UDP-N-acetylglucosamine:LPS N-acetylglucosamine transferase